MIATNIHPLLAQRWSPVDFRPDAVEPEKLTRLLEAARRAPSCYNDQPWFYLAASKDEPEEFARLLSCLVEGNQKWAQNAPLLLISVARATFGRNGKPNAWAWHDVGLASMSLTVQAESEGLSVHQMGGILPDRIRELYALPEDCQPVAGIAIGYAADVPRKETPRKDLSEFVFTGAWGRSRSLPPA
jgi:nitroreductase